MTTKPDTSSARKMARLQKEVKMMATDPPHGIGMWPINDQLTNLEAMIEGPENSPFAGGEFRLDIKIPDGYPNVPPIIKFKTQIYHPNIDSQGRICLDSLKQGQSGSWKPSLNLSTVLTQIRMLMTEPNVQDPLDQAIAVQLQKSPEQYRNEAKRLTELYAKPQVNEEGEIQTGEHKEDEEEDEE